MRHTTTAVLLATSLALVGCSNSSSHDSKPAAKPKASPTVDKAGQFITAVQDANIEFSTMHPSNDELLSFPPKWCAGLANGHSVKYLFSDDGAGLYPWGDEWGMEQGDADKMLVVAVKTYCPKYEAQVTKELRDSGEY
jgi:hypothetical protein